MSCSDVKGECKSSRLAKLGSMTILSLMGVAICWIGFQAITDKKETEVKSASEDKDSPEKVIDFMLEEVDLSAPLKTDSVAGIPQDWVDIGGDDVLRYANFIQDLGLKNISPYHVLYPQFKKRGRYSNSIPPRELWANIVPTLRVIDKLASLTDAKVKPFVRGYYSPSYNRAVRGRSQSQRLTNRAISVQFYGVNSYEVASLARRMRQDGYFKGGVGRYETYVQIDTRGFNADW